VALLRASGNHAGTDYDLSAIHGEGDGGILHGALLTEFAEAVLGTDDTALNNIRSRLVDAIGKDGLVDTAGICASFNAIDRIADATGIPLEDEKAAMTEDFRADLGINEFGKSETSSAAAE
jgi:hypothetical protein